MRWPRKPAARVALVTAAAVAVAWEAARLGSAAVWRVSGDSMRPTLEPGDRVVALPARRRRLRAGAVVVVADPRGPTRVTVKRVVAVAGEVADLAGVPDEVPAGHVAVAGDHRIASTDSRTYGAVPLRLLRGRVRWRLPAAGGVERVVDRLPRS